MTMTTKTTSELAIHVRDLAAAFGVEIIVHRGEPDDAQALLARTSKRRAIRIPPIIDETGYAVALHELGHHLHPLGFVDKEQGSPRYLATGRPATLRDARLRVESERAAWEWARAAALQWTDLMQSVQNMTLGGYEQFLHRLETGRRR